MFKSMYVTMIGLYYEDFFRHGEELGLEQHVIEAAWSYAVRGRLDWEKTPAYMYACMSLACKINSDRDTSEDAVPPIARAIASRCGPHDTLVDWEVQVAQVLGWNLWYEPSCTSFYRLC